jgi:hypothetical protein
MGPKSIANYFIEKSNIDKLLTQVIILEKEKFYKNNNQFKIYPEIYSIFDLLETSTNFFDYSQYAITIIWNEEIHGEGEQEG